MQLPDYVVIFLGIIPFILILIRIEGRLSRVETTLSHLDENIDNMFSNLDDPSEIKKRYNKIKDDLGE